jgi:glycosyltransferase involved in cell wall biosynthesis
MPFEIAAKGEDCMAESDSLPRVSVIIPTYNLPELLQVTIESVLAQTYPNVEIIVIDDGSTDDTTTMMAQYFGQVTYIRQANRGVAAARNAGIRVASGEFFCFLDHDDLIPINKFELQASFLDAKPEFGLVYSGWQYINEDGTQVLGEVRPNKQGKLLKDLLRRSFFLIPGSVVMRRECLERVGLFDESIPAAADTDMWVRIAKDGYLFGYIDQLLFQYRLVTGSMSAGNTSHAQDEFTRLDKFFADTSLPNDIKSLKAEAYSAVHYEFGARYYHAGEIKVAQDHIRKAISICPSLSENKEWLLEWIAGYVLEPKVENPHQLIDIIFDNLPPEVATLRSLRRRAHGRYHTAAAFSAYQNHRIKEIRRHILPALIGDPSIIRNRGFVRIALQSMFDLGT